MTGKIIGVDLGGTNVRAASISGGRLGEIFSSRIDGRGSVEQVLDQIFQVIEKVKPITASGLGIGVPSVVDTATGVVYDVQNIPSWKEVALQKILEEKYGIPVRVNNDANCMALAEKHFGKGKGCENMIGLVIGTGIAGGVIVGGRLFEGANCGAGEFGMIKYLDHHYEYYCSGQFFQNVHSTSGEQVYSDALKGDPKAKTIFAEFGEHVGCVIETILYSYDPELIVLGGSIGKAFDLYREQVWQTLASFAYSPTVKNLKIEVSDLSNPGVMGAAALHFDQEKK